MDVRTGDRNSVIAAINIVPLIDVLLVLIIIFMVISPVNSLGLSALLPQPSGSPTPPPEGTVVVRVLAPGSLSIDQEIVSWQDLGSRLQSIFSRRSEKVAFVDGGNAVEFADVARAMDIMRTAGIDRVGLISGNLPTAR
jgi:biopolymer transport protein ExbD